MPLRHPTSDYPQSKQERDDLFLKVAIALLCLLGVDLALGWILEFYFGSSVISNLSYQGADSSLLPAGIHLGRALGVHYFGDFEEYVGYARIHYSPYNGARPAAYGPGAIFLVWILDKLFGWPGAVFVFLPVSLLGFLWGLVRLLGSSLSARLLAVMLLFSAGVVICLDRGNLQILVAALCVWFAVALLENRRILMIVTLASAIAIKIYLAVFVLVLLRQKRWVDAGRLAGLTAVLYCLGFLFVGGGLFRNIENFFKVNVASAGSPTGQRDFILVCVSAASTVYKTLYLFLGVKRVVSILNHNPGWYIQMPGVIIVCACLGILWWAKDSPEIALVAVLAMIQLAPATAAPYVGMNMAIELCLLLRVLTRSSGSDRDSAVSRRVLILCVALLVVGLVPWFGLIPGRFDASDPYTSSSGVPLNAMVSSVSSIGVVLALLIGLAQARRRTHSDVNAAQFQPNH